jgi:hypothetical protein
MKQVRAEMVVGLMVLLCLSLFVQAQQSVVGAANASVPPLIQFSSVATDEGGNILSGVVNLTFSLYTSQQGGEPLWTETQNNVPLDPTGHYSVQLGITKANGVPTTLFNTGEARWLGVQIAEQAQQPRVLLLSVPYALKAGDAATIGGLPPSAFVLATPQNGTALAVNDAAAGQSTAPPSGTITGTGTVDYIPLWDTTSDIISSVLFQSGSGATAKIGINTTTPTATLNVKGTTTLAGTTTVQGTLALPATGAATATAGKDSQPITHVASAYNSGTSTAVNQTFEWLAEPANNDTSTASGTLNLLFGTGAAKPSETGLNIASNGQITFAAGQTFPGTGTGDGTITGVTTASGSGLTGGGTSGTLTLGLTTACASSQVLQWSGTAWGCATPATGTITGVTAGAGLSGGGLSGNVMLTNAGILALTTGTGISSSGGQNPAISINTKVVPQLAAANTFTGNQTVSGNLSATGVVTGSSFQIGSNLFAFGSYSNGNAFFGFSGNTTTTGLGGNTASGYQALSSNTTGFDNIATGAGALYLNTTGSQNTADGDQPLLSNTTGSDNVATGAYALDANTTGNYNTASGYLALASNTTGNANTGIGNSAGYTADASNLTGKNNTALGTGTVFSTGTLTNATAIGANAEVGESNALVLGSINGVNSATASAFVGIGTTTPQAALDVLGNTTVHTLVGNGGCGMNYAGIGFVVSGGFNINCSNFALLGDNSGNLFINSVESGTIYFSNNNGAPRMVIEPGGNVGIGTGSPDDLLSVNGSADKPGGGSWGTYSDRRLKNLDGSFGSGLDQILKINPVRYRYKEQNGMGISDHDEHVGVVAQEVQKVIPEAVTENSKGYLLVNNDPILWTMLNAIKEQQRQIREQQNLLRAQSAAMRSLEAEVHETREALRKVKAQIVVQPALVAAK